MNTNKIKEYKKDLKLVKKQREILIGLMLGDGHLETQNKGRTYRLKVEQSIRHKKYVDWLYENFKEWVLTKPKINSSSNSMFFNTVSHGSFRFYAQQFYQDRKKIVPKQIYKWLTPLALAVWYMDDGSIKSSKHKGKIINTQCFSKQEVKFLQKCLEERFFIKSILRKQKGNTWQLYLLSETINKFYQIVKPYILPSMRYKLINLG